MSLHPAATLLTLVALMAPGPKGAGAGSYEHFGVAIYARAYEVREMGDLERLRARFEVMERHVKVSKVYLETHRDKILVDGETLEKAKGFFEARGIRTGGGITLTIDERNRFETFCYSDADHRSWVQQVVEHTARHFDDGEVGAERVLLECLARGFRRRGRGLGAVRQRRHRRRENFLGLVYFLAAQRFETANFIEREVGEESQEAADVGIFLVAPVLPIVPR